jgi:hypothetical protein
MRRPLSIWQGRGLGDKDSTRQLTELMNVSHCLTICSAMLFAILGQLQLGLVRLLQEVLLEFIAHWSGQPLGIDGREAPGRL